MLIVRKSQCHSLKTKWIKKQPIELILWNYVNKHNLHCARLLCGLWQVCRGFVSKPKCGDSKPFQSTDFYVLSTEFPFVVMCDVFWIINVCNMVSLGWLRGPVPLFLMAAFGGVWVTCIFLEFKHFQQAAFSYLGAGTENHGLLTTSDQRY